MYLCFKQENKCKKEKSVEEMTFPGFFQDFSFISVFQLFHDGKNPIYYKNIACPGLDHVFLNNLRVLRSMFWDVHSSFDRLSN